MLIFRILRAAKSRADSLIEDYKRGRFQYAKEYRNPIQGKVILFEAFSGNYFVGDPYYIYQYIFTHERFGDFTFLIAANRPKEVLTFLKSKCLVDERTSIIQRDSKEYVKALQTAKYLVNNVSFSVNYIKRPDQIYLHIPHGKAFKQDGKATPNNKFGFGKQQRTHLTADYSLMTDDILIDSISRTLIPIKYVASRFKPIGFPRNSILKDTKRLDECRQKLNTEKKIVLYMPTWRQSGSEYINSSSSYYGERLAEHFKEEYDVYVKLHQIEMYKSSYQPEYAKLIPVDIETYELMGNADILISDYSSVIFDFANTGKKIILFQYDFEEYGNSRGVLPEIKEILPYPVVKTEEELWAEIESPKQYDDGTFNELICKYDSVDSTEKAVNYLMRKNEEKDEPLSLYIVGDRIEDRELLQINEQRKCLFVFLLGIPMTDYEGFNCKNQIDYIPMSVSSNVTFLERIAMWWTLNFKEMSCRKIHAKAEEAAIREKLRVLGEHEISDIEWREKDSHRIPLWIKVLSRDLLKERK